MLMNKVNVYILHSSLVKDSFETLLNYVNKARKEKVYKYTFEKDKLLSLGSSYLLKKYLGDKEIKETKAGKPYIYGGPYFNFSHSGEYSVLAICASKEVGVDIEYIDEHRVNTIRGTLCDYKKSDHTAISMFKLWSNKESLIKCIGLSLSDIRRVPGYPLNGARTFGEETYFTKSMKYKDYSLSVTIKGNEDFEISIIEVKKIEL